jgi:Ca2+-binding EF-hand superfamily protein
MRSRRILLIGATGLLIGLAPTFSLFGQQPGGGMQGAGGRGGGRGGQGGQGGGFRGMMNQDPTERWNQMTGGKDVWVRTEITDQGQQFMFDMIARGANVTGGKITRQQFLDWSEQMRQRFQQGGGMRGGAGGPGGPPQSGQGGQQAGAFNPDAMVEMMFRRYDKNGDGVLNYDEMPDALKAEKDKWDTNKDGLIDLKEFKEYMKGRIDQVRADWAAANPGAAQSSGGAGGAMPSLPTAPDLPLDDEPKRIVYRAGNLPKELPPWFAQLDTDHDGQIGLYEWKKSGRELSEFQKIDRNGDGFLTVEEVLRWQADQNKANGITGPATAGNGQTPTTGGQPGRNFGPGGPNGQRGPGGPGSQRINFGQGNNGAGNLPQDGGQRQGGRQRRQNGGG